MMAVGTYRELVDVVRERGGFASGDPVESVVAITLEALSRCVAADALRVAATRLPARAADQLLRHARDRVHPDPASLYREVAERERVSIGFGLEHTQVVCEVLAELLEGESGAGLRAALPELFRGRDHAELVVHESSPRAHSTLAAGRPARGRPLSEGGKP